MEKNIIRAVYGKGTDRYEETMRKYWHVDRGPFIEGLGFQPGQTVLDAAVGTGLNLPYFPGGVYVVGIDITPEMLEEAGKKDSDAMIELKEMDMQVIGFQDNHFDGAASSFTLCVVEDPKKALGEILRVTKPGSIIGIVDYCKSQKPETMKWQELISYHAANIGFPEWVIVWNSLMDYDELLYHSGLPIRVESDERIESENPFRTAIQAMLRNMK